MFARDIAHTHLYVSINQVFTFLEKVKIYAIVIIVGIAKSFQYATSYFELMKGIRFYDSQHTRGARFDQTTIRESKPLAKAAEACIEIAKRFLKLIISLHIVLNNNSFFIQLTDIIDLIGNIHQSEIVDDNHQRAFHGISPGLSLRPEAPR